MHEEPLHLIPLESQDAVYSEINRRLDSRRLPHRQHGQPLPVLPQDLRGAPDTYKGNWEKVMRHVVVRRLILSEKDRIGIGTFQPKDEKNQDSTRAHGRPQLPQDRRIRLRLGPARLQFRRRAQHRQPRDDRVHRDAQARRGVPLRPARRLAGAQDQAQEVPADRHRRGDRRPHQRARVPQAPEQRARWRRSATGR